MAVSRTRSVEETFDSGCFELFDSDDAADLAGAIRRLYADPGHRARLAAHAAAAADRYRWPHQRTRYLRTVDRLLHPGDRAVPSAEASDVSSGSAGT
jgi:glycosyltransferase involved in cell wall biosynthesis